MSTLFFIFMNILGSFLYFFIMWRYLKDDYEHEKILRTGFIFLFLIYIFGLSFNFLIASSISPSPIFRPQGFWFFGVIMGVFLAALIALKPLKIRIIDLMEAQIPALFFLFFVVSTALGVINHANLWIISIFLYLFFFILYFVLKANYKKFGWYRSGRVGFASLASVGLYFLIRSLIALMIPDMLSLAGRIDAVISFAFAFLAFYSLYNLSKN